MSNKKKKDKHKHQEHKNSHHDVETASELSPPHINSVDSSPSENEKLDGTGMGVTALILSLFAFFLFPFLLSIAGIILGFIGGRRGSAAGWWAVGIGALVLLIRILAFPILAIF